jgi:hypothetical protein
VPGIDLSKYREEVESGLPNEIVDLDEATERQAFFDYHGDRYQRRFRRDAESSFDYQGRSHRPSGFLRQCVEILCEHGYCPGPARRYDDDAADQFLQRVYTDNYIDALFHRADILSTLNERVAIQIDANKGEFATKPITYRLWAREEHVVWCDPDNRNEPQVVCVRDMYDATTRYRLWSDEEVWTFESKKDEKPNTSGGRVAKLIKQEDHDYGCLPFSFIHYELPIQTFDVTCVGEFLWKAEIAIDNTFMTLDESISKHLNPVAWATGVPLGWKPQKEANRFLVLPRAGFEITNQGYVPGEFAQIGYLQAQIAIEGAWEDAHNYRQAALEAAHIPLSAVRMEQTGVASGISLIVEQEPLIKRAENRRRMYNVYENDLARRTLICAGGHYGDGQLEESGLNGKVESVVAPAASSGQYAGQARAFAGRS